MWLNRWFALSPSHSSKTHPPLLLFVSSIARDWLRDGREPQTPHFRLSVDIALVALALAFYAVANMQSRKTSRQTSTVYPLLERDSSDVEHASAIPAQSKITVGSPRFYLLGSVIGALYAIQTFTDDAIGRRSNLTELHALFPVCTLVLLVYLRFAFERSVDTISWASIALQVCGLHMVTTAVSARFGQILIAPAASFVVASSLAYLTTYHTSRRLERSPVNFTRLALVVFTAKFVTTVMIANAEGRIPISSRLLSTALPRTFDLTGVLLFVFECCRPVCILATLDSHDVVVVSVLLTFSSAVWLTFSALFAHFLPLGVVAGCFIALMACNLYLENAQQGEGSTRDSLWLAPFAGITSVLIAAILVAHACQSSQERPSPPSVSQLFKFEASHPNCYPRKRPASLRPLWKSDYHEFDNVLLIVFFSHARYDVNLDFYREVYSKYFPNIVFIGPASREDAGFKHSFDVVVNSYYSDEDVTEDDRGMPKKMSGRMAHHMLYQAMSENDCGYDGYLWAPFDTFLNVPRLQQFDKTRFWYHSPWGHYVPNPAVEADRHAPHASISPNPYPENPEDRYQEPWWWGSREYGLGVCMPAFEKVPLHLRKGLAEYTAGETRLVGGSTDTMYIPSKHAKAFRDTLAIFLETSCFLEIATPTTMHLVAPRREPILFVDHYWIWYSPLNTSFVTQKWAEGFEVDSFHTFHWGDRDEDGVWRAHPRSVEDVRRVLAESALRQGIEWH